ncbi:chromosome partitioning protein [Dactylosporangium sp. NBC_01737]|uniref:chromosome partitioning protein n=1 Tax=Dactylosporangium sp. NBC_01737 TaxID=2975959 RepID=UPI002E129636|nr:chromosome partitioning protein [Dactylosporangium sp. NBC_01737]
MVIEAGLVAGYVIAWAVRKARRAAGRLDAETDAVIDSSLDRLHAVVVDKLGGHPVLEDLADEASADEGQVSELTRQQVELAITAGARRDDAFGQAVTDLVAQLRVAEQAAGVSVVFHGDAYTQATGNGIAFGQVAGDVTVGREGREPPDPR